MFLHVTEDGNLVKKEEVLVGGDALDAAIDSAATLFVAVDGVPYVVAYIWADGKYQEAKDARSKAITALFRQTAVKEGAYPQPLSPPRPPSPPGTHQETDGIQEPSKMLA